MKFVVEMDDYQYYRLEKILDKSGASIEDAIADFFDDLEDTYTAVERITEIEQGLEMETADNSRPDMERRNRGYERLKKYFGTIDREINWKQELQEALDEKYNRAY